MSSIKCKYCTVVITSEDVDVYNCEKCEQVVHLTCMDTCKPSILKGDYLFVYRCRECSYERQDVLTRMKTNWAQITHLTLYNMTILESGRQGFFRWKEEICQFIDRHWSMMMVDKTKTLTWTSTVAGTLSLHCPKLFKSGQNIFRESGWWALREINPPHIDTEIYRLYKSQPGAAGVSDMKFDLHIKDSNYGRGKRHRKERKLLNAGSHNSKSVNVKTTSYAKHDKQQNVNSDGCKIEKIPKLKIKVETDGTASPVNLTSSDKDFTPTSPVTNNAPVFVDNEVIVKSEPIEYDDTWQLNYSQIDINSLDLPDALSMDSMLNPSGRSRLSSDSVDDPFPFFDEALSGITADLIDETATATKTTDHLDEFTESKPLSPQYVCEDTILKSEDHIGNLVAMTPTEELECLQKINSCSNVLACDSSVRRLRRKLSNRKLKRELDIPIFSLDQIIQRLLHKSAPDSLKFMFEQKLTEVRQSPITSRNFANDLSYHHPALRGISVLDRFFRLHNTHTTFIPKKTSFLRLIGCAEDNFNERPITSPYTSRVLKPYIRRDFDSLPPKLNILNDIRKRNPQANPRQWPIDYCYVQPKHIAAVNCLCNEFFWPGIDLTECLQYPDFSCVVLYRKLLIGFAFMVPDVSYNEAYISFILVHPDWQRARIATNMIYHLIQTCMGKDITLHVAPTNSSMMLYHKFGFKAESLILDFYEKYLPDDQKGSRHAYLLRLQR